MTWREIVLPLGVSLAVAQGGLALLARGLGAALPRRVRLVGLALPLLLLMPWLSGARLLCPVDQPMARNLPGAPQVAAPDVHGMFNDVVLQLLPWEMEVRQALREGRLPLWSELLDGGSSPWSNPQAAVLSPLAMLARLFPLPTFLLGALALKLLIAFEGVWLLARATGAGRWAAGLAAASFCLGGPLIAWALFPLGSAVAWAPWLALAAIRLARRRRAVRPAAVAAGAAVTAALLLAGHPETAGAAILFAAACALLFRRRRPVAARAASEIAPRTASEPSQANPSARPLRARRSKSWQRLGAPLPALLAAGALGCGLAAPQLVPFLALLPETQRSARAAAAPPEPGEARIALGAANPRVFGRPFREPFGGPVNWSVAYGGYAGLVVFAGAGAALAAAMVRAAGSRPRVVAPLLAMAALITVAAARPAPLARLLRALPAHGPLAPFGTLRAVAFDRFLPLAGLALALAAAAGLTALLGGARRQGRTNGAAWRRRRLPLLAGVGVAAAASLALRLDLTLLAIWGLIGAAAVIAARGGRTVLARWAAALLFAAALGGDLLPWARDFLPAGHRELFYPPNEFTAAVAGAVGAPADRKASRAAPGGPPWRATASGFLAYPSLLPAYGVAELRINNPVAPIAQLDTLGEVFDFRPETRRYKSAFRHVEHPFLSFLNVRLVIADRAHPPPPPLVALIPPPRQSRPPASPPAPGVGLYLNPGALPRWFIASGAEAVPRELLLAVLARLREPRRVLLAAEEEGARRLAARPAAAWHGWDAAAVRPLRWTPGAVTLELPAAGGEKLLATSLPRPAGWSARIAESAQQPLRSLTINGAYFGAVVPAGVRRLELRFVPPGFVPGVVLGALALALVVLLLAREVLVAPIGPGHRGRRRPQPEH